MAKFLTWFLFQDIKKQKLRQAPKSKSMDFCDIIQDTPNIRQDLLNLFQMQMPKVNESSENEESCDRDSQMPAIGAAPPTSAKQSLRNNLRERLNGYSRTPILNRKERPRSCAICKQIAPTVHSKEAVCAACKSGADSTSTAKPPSSPFRPKSMKKSLPDQHAASFDEPSSSRSSGRHARNANVEIVTSFTDSPVFARKHKREDHAAVTEHYSPSGRRRSRDAELRRRRRDDIENNIEIESHPVEVTPVEPRTFVSFQTQVSSCASFWLCLTFLHIQTHARHKHTLTFVSMCSSHTSLTPYFFSSSFKPFQLLYQPH